MTSLVTLTTDFGTSSGYVAQMKGSFYKTLFDGTPDNASQLTACQLIDLAHDIPEHDIRTAAWFAHATCFHFPPHTLHVIVVDPGVGTSRQIVYVEMGDQRFLVPDNGLLSLAARQHDTHDHSFSSDRNNQYQKHFMVEMSLHRYGCTTCQRPNIMPWPFRIRPLFTYLARTTRTSGRSGWRNNSCRPLREPYYKPTGHVGSTPSKQGPTKLRWSSHQ